ncbi:MAG: ABC-2 family transporter protein [Patescibacteria group bacterium]|nr:ABC-2 family transporter protein [Patescibacteria group bacterium]
MKRYIKLYLQFIKNAFIKESMFRVNFISHTIAELINVTIGVLGLHIIFGQITSLGGWDYQEILLLYGTANIIRGLYFGPFIKNMHGVVQHVRKGTLDFSLLFPVSSQFYVSTREIRLFTVTPLVSGLFIIIYSLGNLNLSPSIPIIFTYASFIFCSVILCYALWFISVTPAIWFPQLREIHEVFISLYGFSRYPPEIFSRSAMLFFTLIIPLLILAAVPTKVLLNKAGLFETFWLPTAALILLYLSNRFWHFALRHYNSASS